MAPEHLPHSSRQVQGSGDDCQTDEVWEDPRVDDQDRAIVFFTVRHIFQCLAVRAIGISGGGLVAAHYTAHGFKSHGNDYWKDKAKHTRIRRQRVLGRFHVSEIIGKHKNRGTDASSRDAPWMNVRLFVVGIQSNQKAGTA